MDEDLRRLHRESRVGLGRHASLINEWVIIDGARTSYRGVLKSVLEVGGGVAVLYIANCRALEALADTNNEQAIGDFEIYSHAILGIGKQPASWDTP